MVPTSSRACLTTLAAAVFWAVFAADAVAQGSVASALDRPLRSIHNSGNWGDNPEYVEQWEQDPSKPLLPPSYVEYLKSAHMNWVGISVGSARRRQHGQRRQAEVLKAEVLTGSRHSNIHRRSDQADRPRVQAARESTSI